MLAAPGFRFGMEDANRVGMKQNSHLSAWLQAKIKTELGFDSLRPIQRKAVSPLLNGYSTLLIAPTAGGKTEAAFFPLLDRMYQQRRFPVSILYVAPLLTLLNNQAPRLAELARLTGAATFVWHGDVAASKKREFLANPSDILLTTPESLDAILSLRSAFCAQYLCNVQAVVIDEVHAFIGSARGAQLMSVMERLRAMGTSDFQRVGLSATVGNPEAMLKYLAGGSRRKRVIVEATAEIAQVHVDCRYAAGTDKAAAMIGQMASGKKYLVFCESRTLVEQIGGCLNDSKKRASVIHSSLSVDTRSEAEKMFNQGADGFVVSTSAMEVGVDTGNLERVIQLQAPSTVSGYLQRRGRTGRRAGQQASFSFVCTHFYSLLRACALVVLANENFVEPVFLPGKQVDVLGQQVLASVLSSPGKRIADLYCMFKLVPSFSTVSKQQFDQMINHMVSSGLLAGQNGGLNPGMVLQKRMNSTRAQDLFSVFKSPVSYVVLHKSREIGALDSVFVKGKEAGEFRFALGGRIWLAEDICRHRRIVRVVPSQRAMQPVWRGDGLPVSSTVGEMMQRVWRGDVETPFLAPSAANHMEHCRVEKGVPAFKGNTLFNEGRRWVLRTFAGTRGNELVGFGLSRILGCVVHSDELGVAVSKCGISSKDVSIALKQLRKSRWPSPQTLQNYAEKLYPLRNAKFSKCVPHYLEETRILEQYADVETARRVVRLPVESPFPWKRR